jgi:hypothetical protein
MIYKTLHRKLEIEHHEQGELMRSRRVGNPCYMNIAEILLKVALNPTPPFSTISDF